MAATRRIIAGVFVSKAFARQIPGLVLPGGHQSEIQRVNGSRFFSPRRLVMLVLLPSCCWRRPFVIPHWTPTISRSGHRPGLVTCCAPVPCSRVNDGIILGRRFAKGHCQSLAGTDKPLGRRRTGALRLWAKVIGGWQQKPWQPSRARALEVW